jgi:two-component system response regulator
MIVVVDDDVDDFEIISEAIRTVEPSSDLRYFRDGSECLTELEKITPRPSLVVLDINMPQMNGFEFLKRIRTHRMLSSIPVVMLTTSNNRWQKEQCAILGATGYLTKPTSWADLMEAAKSILELERKFS